MNQVEERQSKTEPMHRKQAVAFASRAVHLDPVPADTLQLSDGHVSPRNVREEGRHRENELGVSDGHDTTSKVAYTVAHTRRDGRVAVARLAESRRRGAACKVSLRDDGTCTATYP